jgi:hypothetical protein
MTKRLKKNATIMLYVGKYFCITIFIVNLLLNNVFADTISFETKATDYNIYFVSSEGNNKNSGKSVTKPIKSIQQAINYANPGDKIIVLPGEYYENLKTIRSGTKNKPIQIIGTINSVIYGNLTSGGKIVQINHNYIELLNLNINGQFVNINSKNSFHDKIIYIKGEINNPIKGIKIMSSELKNAWGECLRIKLAKDIEIKWNKISNCGLRDFRFNRGRQNGEGIYVGTAPEQMPKGILDYTNDVIIQNNIIATFAAECIDIKEGSENILVKNNICFEEKAKKVGGISIRGNNNKIINNIIFKNDGAGIRIGGDTEKDGLNNIVKNNYLDNNKFALKIMRLPQIICGNIATKENTKYVYPEKVKKEEYFKECK